MKQAALPPLAVYWNSKKIGELRSEKAAPLSFAYADEWVQTRQPAISLSMPVRSETYYEEARSFFGNLLPEGDYRRRIELLFKVSADNDFSLLREIGGDCAGALTIAREGNEGEDGYYEPLSQERLAEIVKTEGSSGMQTGGQSNRLSLAGAQGKLPFRYAEEGFELPQKGAPSTHIMKFNRQSGDYPRLVENEYFMNRTAFHLGMSVVPSYLKKIKEGTILIVERYDRTHGEWPERLHQEDFCQALGYDYSHKYEKEGGPSFLQCVELVRKYLDLPTLNRLIEWYFFNMLMGNSDGHAKNLSLVYDKRSARLAPFYDLVCTRAYQRLDRKMAMACGGEFDPDLMSQRQLKDFCIEVSITLRFANQSLKKIMDGLPHAMKKAEQDIISQGFMKNDIQNVQQTLGKIQLHLARQISAK